MAANAFGFLIKIKREALGLSQRQFSELTHIAQPTISAWETGKQLPSDSTIQELAESLGVPTNELEAAVAEAKGLAYNDPFAGLSLTSADLEFLLMISRQLAEPMPVRLALELLRRRKKETAPIE